ncbi:isoleucine--tRNA ligase [Candidatus Cardinium hertigii]|uniref:Isoleucine--tRNA ligase n=1 Tax=Candidatus Cardinium hertigii TaxID=247481 RepID=A0A2Z3LGY7_9BACT|nr:isoleucine--tRNA ligase [Candidatus Cardinium hertigii]AWN81674.1 Isoleucine--tRNA ligase [Candidatus Cardinium hertigii]
MNLYRIHTPFHLQTIATAIKSFWEKEKIFERSLQQRKNKDPFVFFEGPPGANGKPGIHHVLSMVVKDLFTRYKTMQGYYVQRKSGWDTHGLPVELQVEKELGITKEDIGKKISIQAFNQKCQEAVMTYTSHWEALNRTLGYWKDNTAPYITYSRDYMESVWYLLKALYNKGLLYKGYAIQPYSPAAGSGLSSHELNQPGCYKQVEDLSVVAQFKILDREHDYFLAWTTTPWTLPANTALAVGLSISYVKVATINPYTHLPLQVVLAEEALGRFFSDKEEDTLPLSYGAAGHLPWRIVERCKGVDLIGLRYEQLLPYVQPKGDAFKVIGGDFVTTTEGTGIVHIAPTFGADDYRIAQEENIAAIVVTNEAGEELPIVDKMGRFVSAITDFAGRCVKVEYEKNTTLPSVDILIVNKLKQENKAFKVEKYTHSYPHCWRTQKPILYYPLDAWFIKTTAYKALLIELNNKIQWKPNSIGKGRFGNWLMHLVDWNLSRERYWGTPLPIWRTVDQKEEKCIGSVSELLFEMEQAALAGYMQQPLPEILDLHRPYVDAIVLVSSSGLPMYRETAVVDVWFDSGAMPCAQWHYPFENQENFFKNFPADFIAEGIDQTRGWFFTLHAISGLLFETAAFKNVVVNGLVLDKQGDKMSKSLHNTLDPMVLLDQYGPDAVRWYMISNANPWDNLKFDGTGVEEVIRRFFITLNNCYNFFALYANLDHFYFERPVMDSNELDPMDQWLLARSHALIQTVTEAYNQYEPTVAARAIQDFVVDALSNWYIRLNRKRFWKNRQDQDKEVAYQTLYHCLITIAKLMAPIAPFYADYLYQSLNQVTKKETAASVHLLDFPEANIQLLDPVLERKMQQVQMIVSLAHALRKQHKIKVRQPLPSLTIVTTPQITAGCLASLEALIKAELNVKEVHYADDTSHLLHKQAKPHYPRLGKQYGNKMKQISQAIVALQAEAIATLERGEVYLLLVEDVTIPLTLADVLIHTNAVPGWCIAKEGTITIALDITLHTALQEEGFARELVHRIQQLRKTLNFEVQDKIVLTIQANVAMAQQAITAYKDYICAEAQAVALQFAAELLEGTALDINGIAMVLQLEKVIG